MKRLLFITITLLFWPVIVYSSDWPIYKGNIYYTGNNDEITVKNGNLKWLYEASNRVLNPIVSSGKIYFIDLAKKVYCLDEETGKALWVSDLRQISSQFRSATKSFGKSKYPLIKGNMLFISDNIALYCLDKNSGRVIWARTGMRTGDPNLDVQKNKYSGLGGRNPVYGSGNWQPGKSTYAMVDSIYSDPVIVGDVIYYGTRKELLSRDINNGHLLWNNDEIKSWSKFPSFYDKYLFTQSMDYTKGIYTLYCLDSKTGKKIWTKNIPSPHKIYPPVVYKGMVIIASGSKFYSLDLKNGNDLWNKDYGSLITSNPGFTDRSIIFTLNNNGIVSIDPKNGNTTNTIGIGSNTSPYFVTVRDQIYIASTFEKSIGGRSLPWAKIESFGINDNKKGWEYSPQFPGASSQPVASNGIIFLPAGNYLYAVGTDYYPKIVRGGSGYYDPYNKIQENETPEKKTIDKLEEIKKEEPVKKDVMPMKDIEITVDNGKGKEIPATVEVKKWHNGKVIYSKVHKINRPGKIKIPDMEDVEITASSENHLPEKVIVSKKEDKKKISLTEIEKGKTVVVNNIHFEVNKSHLRKESLNILDDIILQMKRQTSIKLEVRGHTDASGGKEYNQKLSERRADAVVEYMIKNGISPERLNSVGFGETKPIASNSTRAGRSKNRRTEFYIMSR